MRLWGIHQWIKMQPYLEPAAEAGDVEAMYCLGEASRLLVRGLSGGSMNRYLQAAEQNDVYAMLRLFQGGALAVALPQAEAGDADVMGALYDIYTYLDQHD